MPFSSSPVSYVEKGPSPSHGWTHDQIHEHRSEINDSAVGTFSVGLRVVRGSEWPSGGNESDGGEGIVGTVVHVGSNSSSSAEKNATIQWDMGSRAVCGIGYYDLCVLDNSSIGIKHPGVNCCACKQKPIMGMRWKCLDCKDSITNLCTSCYMTDEHNTSHAFERFNGSCDGGVPVEKRNVTRKIEARGIFPGAKVSRGPDWESGMPDEGTFGKVTKITDWQGNPASAAEVSWESGAKGTYRLGYQGKADLMCVNPGSGGYFYTSHLPRLGPSEKISDSSDQSTEESSSFSSITDDGIHQFLPPVNDGNTCSSSIPSSAGSDDVTSPDFQMKHSNSPWKTRAEETKGTRRLLHTASINGNWDKVKRLLEKEDVDQRDKFLLTPLHLAAWYGHESVVELLLQHRADFNAVDRFQKTPLQKAQRRNHHSIVQLLRSAGAAPSYQQPLSLQSLAKTAFLAIDQRSGFNMLHAAVYEGDYNTVLAASVYIDNFLKEMETLSTLNNAPLFPAKTASGILADLNKKGHDSIKQLCKEHAKTIATLTELHKCCESDDAEMAVELVLHHGRDINITASGKRTPLVWASLRSSAVFFKTLIDLGADPNFQREDRCTPLIMASYWNNYMAARLLTETGVDVDVQCDSSNAALHVSAMKGFLNISKLLIKTESDVNLQNNGGKTPLHLAVQNGHKHVVKVLLESKADVTIFNKHDPKERLFLVRGKDKGNPAWHYVMVEKCLLGLFRKRTNGGQLDVADFGIVLESGWGENPPEDKTEEILNKSVGVFGKEVKGKTPLHVACEIKVENLEIIELLVKYGVDIDTRDGDGYTALQMASIRGKMKIVTKLVELNADVNLTTNDGKDAADLAQLNEELDIAECLKLKRNPFRKLWNTLIRR